jgi:histidinol dehydrogenase
MAEGIKNAGSVFLGEYSPDSAGDYASGTNHTLPTNGSARAYSGVNIDSFMKKITYQEISRYGLFNIGPSVEKMAEAEALDAHRNAIRIRMNGANNYRS